MVSISQFPMDRLPEAWQWLQQFPLNNFDDFGPRTCDEFQTEMYRRLSNESLTAVSYLGELCGIVGLVRLSPRVSMFHGICFDAKVHGIGIASRGVNLILNECFRRGAAKVSANYFADNLTIHRFLWKLGFIEEGYLHNHTVRQGKPVDMKLVSLFARAN